MRFRLKLGIVLVAYINRVIQYCSVRFRESASRGQVEASDSFPAIYDSSHFRGANWSLGLFLILAACFLTRNTVQ